MKDKVTIFLVSLGVSLIISVPLIIVVWPNMIFLAYVVVLFLSISLGPLLTYNYFEQLRLKDMEKHLPSFLQMVAENKRSGLSLPTAISNAASINHGALTKDVKKMANQLSWGVPLPDVLKMFQKRTKKSVYINRAIGILLESYYSGGDVAATLDAISNSINTLKEVEAERDSVLREQVIIIYAIHFIFVGIIIAMYKIMLPLLAVQGTSGASLFGASVQAPDVDYFKTLFFITLVIQSVSNGLVAGEAREGNLSASVKHIAIMLVVSLVGYTTFILPKQVRLVVNLRSSEVRVGREIIVRGVLEEEGSRVEGATVIVDLLDSEEIGSTDENGEFQIIITAPSTKGVYNIEVTAIYGREEVSVTKQVFVTS